jgi:aryl sulfotransferase
MNQALPSVTRVYQNHHLDSTRWEGFMPRDDDIIVTTSYKSGTTFTQQILTRLLYGHLDPMPERDKLSPWIDARFHPQPLTALMDDLEAMRGRRFIKSHLALDGLPYYPGVKYLIVGRDPRDVFMSFYNHYGNYTDFAYGALDRAGANDGPMPRCPDNIHIAWDQWINRGWFEWESEGYPFWGNMHHTQSYWNYRHLPNFLFLHYADMRRDLPGTVRRLAAFIDHPVTSEVVDRVVHESSFETVKRDAEAKDAANPETSKAVFAGGESAFIYKGTNGRWRHVLTQDELGMYERAKARVLSPDCAAWLEDGGVVTP